MKAIIYSILFLLLFSCSGEKQEYTEYPEYTEHKIEFNTIKYTYRVSEYKRIDTLEFHYLNNNYIIRERFYDDKVELSVKRKDTIIYIKNNFY
jgi:hypothetical protein